MFFRKTTRDYYTIKNKKKNDFYLDMFRLRFRSFIIVFKITNKTLNLINQTLYKEDREVLAFFCSNELDCLNNPIVLKSITYNEYIVYRMLEKLKQRNFSDLDDLSEVRLEDILSETYQI